MFCQALNILPKYYLLQKHLIFCAAEYIPFFCLYFWLRYSLHLSRGYGSINT